VTAVHSFLRTSGGALALGLSIVGCVGCVGGDAPDDPYASGGNGGKGGSTSTQGGRGGSTSPSGGSGGSGSAGLAAGSKDSHFPLIAGATWTYHHKYPQDPGKQEWDEIATMESTTYEGEPAFILEDEEDAQGERSASTMVIDGTKVLRAFKEVKVADQIAFNTKYDPGFLRFDEAWTTVGAMDELTYESTQNCVTASSASKCVPSPNPKVENTTHTYKVLSLDAEVTVEAGTFKTVQIERVNVGDPAITGDEETKQFWYAPGIGKVRELDTENLATEELRSYNIP
jgi:hypothetical protein